MLDYEKIPVAYMGVAMRDYMERGVPPGEFLTALLSNDLMQTFREADENNREVIFQWCRWLHNEAPPLAYGSPKNVRDWITARQTKRASVR